MKHELSYEELDGKQVKTSKEASARIKTKKQKGDNEMDLMTKVTHKIMRFAAKLAILVLATRGVMSLIDGEQIAIISIAIVAVFGLHYIGEVNNDK